mmetsp:Transcript_7646/g.10538  ORF Transcript_7646/g.10538 Transcript_7646/m.10538 type:complete len:221 (+) Transcript_7646:1045-1707(+)
MDENRFRFKQLSGLVFLSLVFCLHDGIVLSSTGGVHLNRVNWSALSSSGNLEDLVHTGWVGQEDNLSDDGSNGRSEKRTNPVNPVVIPAILHNSRPEGTSRVHASTSKRNSNSVEDQDGRTNSKRSKLSRTIFSALSRSKRGQFTSKRRDSSGKDNKDEDECEDHFSTKTLSWSHIRVKTVASQRGLKMWWNDRFQKSSTNNSSKKLREDVNQTPADANL